MTACIGFGFNGAWLEDGPPIDGRAPYVEAGIDVVCRPERLTCVKSWADDISLHISRVPFCEPTATQNAYCAQLAAKMPVAVKSVGLHLCGPLRAGLGLLGLGTPFEPTPDNQDSARRFIKTLQTSFASQNCAVLLENANYYDRDLQTALKVIEFTNSVCRTHGVGLILDLAHLCMQAENLGVRPEFLLGRVDLTAVEVVHLSGMVEGTDGLLHDGHNRPVHSKVWDLLDAALPCLPKRAKFVLEHTDRCWEQMLDQWTVDYVRLQAVVQSPSVTRTAIDLFQVGLGYMEKIVLPQRFPDLVHALGNQVFSRWVRAWGEDFLSRVRTRPDHYVVMRPSDWIIGCEHTDLVADFIDFILQQQEVDVA